MGFLKPTAPPYDPLVWEKLPFRERARQSCQAWALQGYGTPIAIYFLYAIKILALRRGVGLLLQLHAGHGRASDRSRPGGSSRWRSRRRSSGACSSRASGLGCGSGPLTGRYFPPVGGFLYFLRPGTTKLPLFPGAPIVGGFRRTWLDVALYAACAWRSSSRRWSSAQPSRRADDRRSRCSSSSSGSPTRRSFLAARGEHFWTTLIGLRPRDELDPAARRRCMLALWFWAGVSKLNHHFPSVVCVMTTQQPRSRASRGCASASTSTTPTTCARRCSRSSPHGGTRARVRRADRSSFSATAARSPSSGSCCMVLLHTLHHEQRSRWACRSSGT